jgi:hypothetical protein
MRENLVYLVASKHHRQTRGCFRAFHTLEPSDLLFKHLFVEEKKCAQRLVLRRSRYPTFPSQISEKLCHFRFRHLTRVPFIVKKNEPANPIHIRLLGSDAKMFAPDHVPNLIEQFRLVPGCLDR